MDVVQSIVNADNRSEVEKFTSCLDNWKQWSWTLSPGPLPRRLSYLPESDSGVSFHQLLTPDNKQKIITIEVCIYKSISEKAMATHSNTLAWKIPWTEEPGRLQSMGSVRVGHDWATSLSLLTFLHWRRKWQPTPVFLPGEPQGRGSLVGCRLWGHTESDMTEVI